MVTLLKHGSHFLQNAIVTETLIIQLNVLSLTQVLDFLFITFFLLFVQGENRGFNT